MKKVCSILAITLLITAGCGGNKKSSSNEVELWVKNNLTEIRQIREEFKNTIHTLDQYLYAQESGKFTFFQEHLLWVGKILEVLEFDWTEQERKHLELLLELIVLYPTDYFGVEFLEFVSEESLKKGLEWLTYAEKELGWDDDLIDALLHTPAPMNANKDVDPKFKRLIMKMIDGVYVPHMQVDGGLVPVKLTADRDYVLL